MPASMPRALTARRRSTAGRRADGESSQPRSDVAFIFIVVKPWALRAELCRRSVVGWIETGRD